MFSGIVEELGIVRENGIAAQGRLSIGAAAVLADAGVGDSIAVNGCCLTISALEPGGFRADVMPETARRTNLGALGAGSPVDLEASLRLGARVGGHLLTGHVDATAQVLAVEEEGNASRVRIALPAALAVMVAAQGCVAVDGISLTVVEVDRAQFTVSLIPHTLEVTVARHWGPGTRVNLEVDQVARYALRAADAQRQATAAAEDVVTVFANLAPRAVRVAGP